MRFSIVIPLYNKAKYISETLSSLVQQTKQPFELIIVDDCSTDGSLEIAKTFLESIPISFRIVKIQIIELDKNYGPGYARNIGFSATSGDIVSFLDADDIYIPQLIKRVDQLFTNNYISFLTVGIKLFPSKIILPKLKNISPYMERITSDAYLLKHPLKVVTSPDFVMGTGSNVFVKRKYLITERYEEDVSFNEGNDYWYRILKVVLDSKKPHVALLMGNYIEVREVQGSLSRQKYTSWKQIEVPPIYTRYKYSSNIYDILLVGVICNRWLKHSLKNLSNLKQKIVFLFKYRKIIVNQLNYVVHKIKTK
jgi:glycosyltransferase involved in cell wall biosynthesis